MTQSPFHTSVLFQSCPSYGNAVFNFMHASKDEFGGYASVFHRAGQRLAEKTFAFAGYNDLDACPIVFLYRHSLELYLKAIVLIGTSMMHLNGKVQQGNERLLRTHHLSSLLPMVKSTYDVVGWTWQLEIEGLHTFEEFEMLVQELEAVDPGSYTFRYPVDTVGQPSVPHHFRFHVPTFCARMDALLDELESATMGLGVTLDQMLEAVYYAQH